MRNVSVIARRELTSLFTSPLAYVAGAVFLLLVGVLFATMVFQPGQEASMRALFMMMVPALVLAIPLLTMPLMSEEYARGTIETMMTAPVTESDLVLGKFAGALGFYVLLLATTLLHLALLAVFGEPETGQALMGYFGMLLVGAMFISIGLFFSCTTKYQLLAALLGVVVLAALTLLPMLPFQLFGNAWVVAFKVFDYVGVPRFFEAFAKGFFDTRSLVFFVSVTARWMVASSSRMFPGQWETRSWRQASGLKPPISFPSGRRYFSRKCSASGMMSSLRSRRGGSVTVITFRR